MKPTFLRTFSLRSLIVGVTLCGIGLAIYVSPWAEHRRQLRLLDRVEELGEREQRDVFWGSMDRNYDGHGNARLTLSRPSPALLKAIIEAKLIKSVFIYDEQNFDLETRELWEGAFRRNIAWERRQASDNAWEEEVVSEP